MITAEQRQAATVALRAAGFDVQMVRELLAGPKGLRDELAGQALAGLIPAAAKLKLKELAQTAYLIADTMMETR
jgi:hypothetical protein